MISTGEVKLKDSYSTFNFSVTDGETMVVTRFCDKDPNIPPPSLYFAFALRNNSTISSQMKMD
jgi:hypothetical protein